MRDLWVDNNAGRLLIETETMRCCLYSKAYKNYHHVKSNWSLYFSVRGQYGYMATICCTFADTIEGAMNRAETMMMEIYGSLQEIMEKGVIK